MKFENIDEFAIRRHLSATFPYVRPKVCEISITSFCVNFVSYLSPSACVVLCCGEERRGEERRGEERRRDERRGEERRREERRRE
jgi:hypothetical protein